MYINRDIAPKAPIMRFIKGKGGLATYAEIIKAGFDKRDLRTLLKSRQIDKIDRGLYKLQSGSNLSHPDLVAVSIKIPNGVVCLISALYFHEATKEIPSQVAMAIPRGAHAGKINYPPTQIYRFTSNAWESGIEEHKIGQRSIKVYNLAKTIADCFKFRNKIGMDIVRDAIKTAITEKGVKPNDIMFYAKICRVDTVIKPILEAMI